MEGSPAASFTQPLESHVGSAPIGSFPIVQLTDCSSRISMTNGPIDVGVHYVDTSAPIIQVPQAPPRTDATVQVAQVAAPRTDATVQVAQAAPPRTDAPIQVAQAAPPRTDAPQTTVIQQAREQTEAPQVTPKPADGTAWSTPNVKADLAADATTDRQKLSGPDDAPIIHVQKAGDESNWPDKQTPDVVIGKDGVHVRSDLDTAGKTYKDLYVKIEDGADEKTVESFMLKDMNKLTNGKATIDPAGSDAVPKSVSDEYNKHENAPPPSPTAGDGKPGDGKPAPPPSPPPEVSPEEKKRLDDLDKAEREKEQAASTTDRTKNYKDVMSQFDAKGGLADARSAALSWCPPELQGEYAALLAGMHHPPTPEELAKLQEWLKKNQSKITEHTSKNAAAMEAMDDKDGAEKLRELTKDIGSDDWMSKHKDFIGQSADAIQGKPTESKDLGLGQGTFDAVGHSTAIDKVVAEFHKQNPNDSSTTVAQMFGDLSSDKQAREQMVEEFRRIGTADQAKESTSAANPQVLDLNTIVNGYPR